MIIVKIIMKYYRVFFILNIIVDFV